MKLISRRKKDPTPLERAAKFAKLGAHALTAQRVARKGHRNYKRGKRLAIFGGLAAIGAAIAKKVRGGGAETYTPPQSGSGNVTDATPGATGTTTPPVNGGSAEPRTEPDLEVEAPNESTPPPPEKAKAE